MRVGCEVNAREPRSPAARARARTAPFRSRVKESRARQDAAIDQPRGNHGAFFSNRPIDEKVETPTRTRSRKDDAGPSFIPTVELIGATIRTSTARFLRRASDVRWKHFLGAESVAIEARRQLRRSQPPGHNGSHPKTYSRASARTIAAAPITPARVDGPESIERGVIDYRLPTFPVRRMPRS
jgi:hypothetical protein